MKIWAAMLSLCLYATATFGHDFACLADFATLSADDADGQRLVSETYRELLDQLGTKLKPETLAAWAESPDPFSLPDQPGADLSGLQRRLRDFRAMVEAKGWYRPEILSALTHDLRRMHSERGRATQRIEEVKASEWIDHPVVIPDATYAALTLDGRHLMTRTRAKSQPIMHTFLWDTVTGNRVESPGLPPDTATTHGFFSGDGTEVIFPREGTRFTRFPVHAGKVDWSRPRPITDDGSTGTNDSVRVHHTGNPQILYVANNRDQLFRLDLKANARHRLWLEGNIGKKNLKSWSSVPGTENLSMVLVTRVPPTYEIRTVKVLPDNSVETLATTGEVALKPPHENSGVPHHLWSSDGKTLITYTNPSENLTLSARHGLNGTPKDIYSEAINGADYGNLAGFSFHPTKPLAAFTFFVGLDRSWVEVIDLTTLERKASIPLPGLTQRTEFIRGGDELLGISGDEGRVINYRARMEGE